MQLTEHFKSEEFMVSRDFPELAAAREISAIEWERIRFFCAGVLEPLRLRLGSSIRITSGVRSLLLNSAVGGHARSHHLFQDDHGACDIVVSGIAPEIVAQSVVRIAQVRMVIIYDGFVHLSFPDDSGIYNQVRRKLQV